MQSTIGEDSERLGFHLRKRRSRSVGPVVITDLDIADDLVLVTVTIDHAQELLIRLEVEAVKWGYT